MEELSSLDEIASTSIVPFVGPAQEAVSTPRRSRTLQSLPDESPDITTPLRQSACSEASEGGTPKPKKCYGCGRLRNVSKSFYDPGELVSWPLDRCSWCTDCFSCHRSLHSKTISLLLFTTWLDSNTEQWGLELAAYVCLKMEGATKILAATVSQRVQQFRFMAAFLGVPTRRMGIMMLRNLMSGAEPSLRTAVHSSTLWPIVSLDGSVAPAALVLFPRGARTEIELPNLDERPVRNRSFPVSDDTDAELITVAVGGDGLALVVRNMHTAIVPVHGSGTMGSKLDGKLYAQKESAKTHLAVFGKKSWETSANGVFLCESTWQAHGSAVGSKRQW